MRVHVRPLAIMNRIHRLLAVQEATSMKTQFDRVTVNPGVMKRQPCIREMRLTVRRVLLAIALYPDNKGVKAAYPELEDDDISQALEYAATNLERTL